MKIWIDHQKCLLCESHKEGSLDGTLRGHLLFSSNGVYSVCATFCNSGGSHCGWFGWWLRQLCVTLKISCLSPVSYFYCEVFYFSLFLWFFSLFFLLFHLLPFPSSSYQAPYDKQDDWLLVICAPLQQKWCSEGRSLLYSQIPKLCEAPLIIVHGVWWLAFQSNLLFFLSYPSKLGMSRFLTIASEASF